MTPSSTPLWRQTATKKQKLRDEAIQRFMAAETSSPEVHPRTHINVAQADDYVQSIAIAKNSLHLTTIISSVEQVSKAISSHTVTATQLLLAYIHR